MRFTKLKWLAAICVTAIIAGCGGDDKDDNKPVDPAPPPVTSSSDNVTGTGTVELAANTHVVTKSEAAGSTLTDDTFTVTKPQAKVYKVGDILVTDAHGGRLIRVVGVRETGTEIHYQYEQASLAEAFETIDVHIQGTLTEEDLRDPSQAKAFGASTQLGFNYGGAEAQAGAGITVGGNATFKLSPDIRIKKDGVFAPLEFTATVSPSLATSLTFTAQAGAQISYAANKNYAFNDICVTIGPVPVCFTPVVDLSAEAIGWAGGSFSTTLGLGIDGEFGIQGIGGKFSPVASVKPWASLDVSVDSELGVTLIAPKMEVSLMFYSAAGPYVDIGVESSLKTPITRVTRNDVEDCPGVEILGREVNGSVAAVGNAGLKANKKLIALLGLDSNSVGFELFSKELASKTWFNGTCPPSTRRPTPILEPGGEVVPGVPGSPSPGGF